MAWGLFDAFAWVAAQQMPAALKWTLHVLVHEAVHEAGGEFVARITQHDLARLTCSSRRTMVSHLTDLETRRLVEKMGTAGDQTGLEYRLMSPRDLGKTFTGRCEKSLQVPVKNLHRSGSRYIDARASSLNSSSQISLIPTGGEGAAPGGAPARAVTRAKSLLPEGFEPDAKAVAMAKAMKLNPHALAAEFRDHYAANGKPMADWQASFRSWIRKEIKLRAERGGAGRFL
jgi:hypothetical protein